MFNYIDLFSGIGGLALGFERAGFKNIFSVEFDQEFAAIYKNNFPTHKLIEKDIKLITNNEIKKNIGSSNVDLIIGGPPCQGFSLAGKIARNFLEDERNFLFKEFVRFVDIIKPKAFLLENVAALERHNKGNTLKSIITAFNEIGYDVVYKVVNSKYHKVPQERRRIILIGTIKKNEFRFPIENKDFITVKQAIEDLPRLESGEKSNIPNHVAMNHSKQMLEKMSYVKDGNGRNDIPANIKPQSGDIRKYIRYDSQKPSICITGDMRKVFHYEQNRALTIRELARLQTFPDNFTFLGKSGKIQQSIGNAVPPQLAYELALMIKEVLYE